MLGVELRNGDRAGVSFGVLLTRTPRGKRRCL